MFRRMTSGLRLRKLMPPPSSPTPRRPVIWNMTNSWFESCHFLTRSSPVASCRVPGAAMSSAVRTTNSTRWPLKVLLASPLSIVSLKATLFAIELSWCRSISCQYSTFTKLHTWCRFGCAPASSLMCCCSRRKQVAPSRSSIASASKLGAKPPPSARCCRALHTSCSRTKAFRCVRVLCAVASVVPSPRELS